MLQLSVCIILRVLNAYYQKPEKKPENYFLKIWVILPNLHRNLSNFIESHQMYIEICQIYIEIHQN